jgi:predicted TIM-barrel enzyme
MAGMMSGLVASRQAASVSPCATVALRAAAQIKSIKEPSK